VVELRKPKPSWKDVFVQHPSHALTSFEIWQGLNSHSVDCLEIEGSQAMIEDGIIERNKFLRKFKELKDHPKDFWRENLQNRHFLGAEFVVVEMCIYPMSTSGLIVVYSSASSDVFVQCVMFHNDFKAKRLQDSTLRVCQREIVMEEDSTTNLAAGTSDTSFQHTTHINYHLCLG
jgi:hypothetical protein